jgi:ABC-type multidrug transport system ATPase subunit
VRICGENPWADPGVRRKIGFVTHEPMLYGGLSVRENLRLFATLHGLRDPATRAEAACDCSGLARRDDLVRVLSRGLQQRAAFARAILHEPAVLLLDEVLSGLDLEAAQNLGQVLQGFRRGGGAVVLATHNPTEAVRVADSAYVLIGGRLVGPRSLDGLEADSVVDWYVAATSRVPP